MPEYKLRAFKKYNHRWTAVSVKINNINKNTKHRFVVHRKLISLTIPHRVQGKDLCCYDMSRVGAGITYIRCCPCDGLIMGHRLRRWPIIKPSQGVFVSRDRDVYTRAMDLVHSSTCPPRWPGMWIMQHSPRGLHYKHYKYV